MKRIEMMKLNQQPLAMKVRWAIKDEDDAAAAAAVVFYNTVCGPKIRWL
mgnify:CR=1 FL=1